jgi:hypothetical protein
MADLSEKTAPLATDNKAQLGNASSSDENIAIIEGGDINEASLLRKLDYKLLPGLSVLYLLSFLDRSNGMFSASTISPSNW